MPSEFRVGLLGAGYIADWHYKALRTVPHARVVAVCDQSADRAAALTQRCRAESTHTSLEEMLTAGPLDAVHILLPPTAHLEAARMLLDRGVAAYIEKPFGVDAGECQELAGLSDTHSGKLAVGHNFLFTPGYEQLKSDLATGRIGRIEHVTIVWAKEFGQLRAGPFGAWVFRHPANIMLEVGPHLVAHILDLVGEPDCVHAETLDPILLPNGAQFFRQWLIRTYHGRACVDVQASFGPGFTEHRLEVRGTAGTATVDFEAGTYVLRRRTHLPTDFDRYARTRHEARTFVQQARGTLTRYVFSKLGLACDGNPFGASIARAIRRFYSDLPQVSDPRLTAQFGAAVVRTCHDIARAAGHDPTATMPKTARHVTKLDKPSPDVLVLGGTGFIGRALVCRLANAGRRVRLMARDPNSVPETLRASGVEVCRGDLSRRDELVTALEGISSVIHLARSQSRTWTEYLRDDVGVTRAVAEACLTAGVRRLVYTGTTDSYYSGRDEVITEATPLDQKIHRRNLYARAKAESERHLLALHRERGLPVVIARPAIVIGPGGDPHHWGIGSWASPDTCRLWGDGKNPVPLVLADDVAAALVRCMDIEGINGEVFNLAADASITARDYLATMSKALHTWIDVRPSSPLRYYAGDMMKWMVKTLIRHPERRFPSYRDWKSRTYRARYDCSKAKRILGWVPVSDKEALLAEGVRRASVEWAS